MKTINWKTVVRRLTPMLSVLMFFLSPNARAFIHPGCLSTTGDFARMQAMVQAGAHPWIDSYNKLITYSQAQTNWGWAPVTQIIRTSSGGNFARCQQDALAIYYNALRYRITGDVNFANHAIQGMDAWSGTCTNVSGDSNSPLGAGLCGYEFACAGEALRGYSGWSQSSINAYSNFLETVFYSANNGFLTGHNGTCDTHYRANWDACNMASMIAVAVFCDDNNAFNQAIAYYTNGVGNGMIDRAVAFVHPDGLGQEEESGRDQAHTIDGINSLSTFCQIAWNQGVDMYGYENNRYLRVLEYVAKYNIYNNSWVPYVHHRNCLLTYDEASIWGSRNGVGQFFWETPAAHYVNVMGIAAPFTAQAAAFSRPDSGISNWNSPDWFGFTTLTSYRGPATNSAPAPSGLMATVSGQQITLNWWGTALATSYNVKRATSSGGPYTTIAVTGPNYMSYVDTGLTLGTTYYYVLSANQPGGESANSEELAAVPNDVISGTVIGSPGSYNNTSATIVNAFDGSFESFYDAANGTGDWTGIDPGLGVDSVGSVITSIDFAPRPGLASRMVGGEFQGALDGDPNFASPVTLYTVASQPTDGFVTAQNGVLTSAMISDPTAYRYLRYIGPANGSCNVSQVIFHGSSSGLTTPATPVNVTATTPSYKEVDLTWNSSDGATSYTIKRATNSGGPYLVLENLTSVDLTALNSNTNYSDYSALANTTYYYVVAALNSSGETDSSETTATTPAMVVPTNLTVVPGDTLVSLSWSGTGAPTYNVKRSSVSGGPYTIITNITISGFADTDVANGSTYYYVVSAVDGGSESANSAEVSVTPGVQTAISIDFVGGGSNNGTPSPMVSSEKAGVTGSVNWNNASSASGTSSLVQNDGTATGASVSWSANNTWSTSISGAPGNTRMMKGYLDTSSTSKTTVTVSNIPSAYTSSGYSVYVYFDGDNGSSTKTGVYTIGTTSINGMDQGSVNFSGTFVRASGSAGNYVVFPNQTAAVFTLSAMGSTNDGSGARAPINGIQVVAGSGPAAPTGLSASGGNAAVYLSWAQSTSPGITGNNVYRSTTGSGGPYNQLANLGPAIAYLDTGVVNGNTYFYTVTAVSGNGESGMSAYAGATPQLHCISVNFRGGSTRNGTPANMSSSESAGVIAVSNWNNANGVSGTVTSLAQNDGTATASSATWSCNNTWSIPITETAGNYRMMKGYLDTSSTSTSSVTVSNLSSTYTAHGYDVYVYCDGDNQSSTKTGRYTIGSNTITATDNGGSNFSGTFSQANNSAGNYVVFANQTAGTFKLTAVGTSTDSGPRAPINSIQVVAH